MEELWENPEVDIKSLPSVEGASFQLHPIRYRKYRLIMISLIWIIPFFAVIPVVFNAPYYVGIPVLVVLLALMTLSAFSIFRGYRKRSYALRQKDLTYKKGWIFSSVTTIPFNRIQHTEISHGPLERKFKLCSLKIYTAGGSSSDLSIPGLEYEEAEVLKDFIAQKVAVNV